MKMWKPLYYSVLGLAFGAAIYLSFTNSIQLNESYSLWLSTKSILHIVRNDAQNFSLPLYSLLLHFWVQILGTDIVIVRLLSVVLLGLTVLFLYRLAFEASSNEEVSLVTIVLFAISPLILWYTTEAQVYALFTLVVAANHVYFLRLQRSGGKEGKLGFFTSTIAGLFTHYLFLFLILSQLLYIIGCAFSRQPRRTGSVFVPAYFLLTVLAGIMFGAWALYLIRLGLALPQKLTIAPAYLPFAGQLFTSLFLGFPMVSYQNLLVALWPLSVVFLFLIFTRDASMRLRNTTYFLLVTFLPIILTFSVSFLQPYFDSRYLIFTVPTLFILTGWLLLNFSKKVFPLTLLIVLVTIGSLLIAQVTSPNVPIRENYNTVVSYVSRQATPYDIVAIASPFAIYPVEYYYNGPARLVTIPDWNQYASQEIPPFSLDGMTAQVRSYRNTYSRLFVILSYDQGYNGTVADYLDHHYERLAFHVYPPNIQLRVYRLSYNFSLP